MFLLIYGKIQVLHSFNCPLSLFLHLFKTKVSCQSLIIYQPHLLPKQSLTFYQFIFLMSVIFIHLTITFNLFLHICWHVLLCLVSISATAVFLWLSTRSPSLVILPIYSVQALSDLHFFTYGSFLRKFIHFCSPRLGWWWLGKQIWTSDNTVKKSRQMELVESQKRQHWWLSVPDTYIVCIQYYEQKYLLNKL